MESFLIYMGKVALAAGSFYLLYLALFQHQKQFLFNRIYLPFALLISFVIPLITFTSVQYIQPLQVSAADGFAFLPESTGQVQAAFVFQWYHYLFGIYLLGTIIFLTHLLFGHLKAINIIRFSRLKEIFGAEVNITSIDVHPFSFFNRIVIAEKTVEDPNLEMIVNHEMVHVREKHTWDILFVEVLFLLQWFNPFAWLLRDAVRSNLEYLTDDQITKEHNAEAYQLAMVGLAHKKGVAPFLTALNGSQLKNRIIMMKKKTENRYSLLKQLVVLPLLAILIMSLSNKEVRTEFAQAEKPLQVVVDGASINQKDLEAKGVDLTSGFDGLEIMRALGIEEKVILNGFTDETNPSTYFIQTSDYVVGSNLEFDKLVVKPEKKESSAPAKTLVAIDGKILSDEEAQKIDKWEFESASILTGKHALEKYGDEAQNASVMDLKTESDARTKEIVVKGKVTNTKGEPIVAATVVVEGTTTGTITNMEGEYELMVANSDAVLVFSMLGYKFKKVAASKENINVMLARSDIESTQTPYGIAVKNKYLVKGKVTNEKGEPIVGAAILVKGETSGTISNMQGEYVLQSNSEFDKLVVMMMGYAAKEVSASGKEELDVVLKADDSADKKEINVVGYKKKEPVDQEAVKLELKGDSKNPPLYIVDGEEVESAEHLEPNDIESISVLKGESATSLYGDKGKNGVVLINTKEASKKKMRNAVVIVDGKKYDGDVNDIDPTNIKSMKVLKGESATDKYGPAAKDGAIVIRSNDPFGNGETPLYVVDGVKYKGDMKDIDPDNIESITVLKDASATASYGSEGKNGVLLITTKSSGKAMITSELELRKYIAKRIKYPSVARDAGITGNVEVAAKIDKYGKLTLSPKDKPEKRIKEVVVVALKPEVKKAIDDEQKAYEALEKEAERVINGIHSVLIDDLKNTSVAFTIKFQLQDKE